MRISADPDTDPGQTLSHKMLNFLHEKYAR
jgi:hypothetical protein